MEFKSILMYGLALLLIGITGINLYITMTAKGRRDKSKNSFHKVIWPIEERLLSEMKGRGLNYTVVRRLLNDKDQGIIFASDPEKRKAVIAMADSSLHFDFADLKESKALYKQRGNKVEKAEVRVTIKDSTYIYEIASREFNPKSFLGKVLYETAEELNGLLAEIRNS